MDLTLKPSLLQGFTVVENSSSTAPVLDELSSPPPLQLMVPLLSPVKKNATTTPPLNTTLSLGSLNIATPKKPCEKDNTKTTTSLISESSTTHTQSVVTQEEDTVQVADKKIDQDCSADSRHRVKLFGVSLGYDDDDGCVYQIAVKKRKMDHGGDLNLIGQQEHSFDFLPLKKRTYFRGDFVYQVSAKKKRKMEVDSVKYLPFKKRACFRGGDDTMIKMRKVLTQSDVNSQSRILLGNKVFMIDQILPRLNLSVETFVNSDHGEKIKVYDTDTKKERTLVLKKWITNSFIINGGWRKYFVKERDLRKGDEIELSWDHFSKRLNFSLVKRAGSSSS